MTAAVVSECASAEAGVGDLAFAFDRAVCAFTPVGNVPVTRDRVCAAGTRYGIGGQGLLGLGDLVSGVVTGVTSVVGNV